MWNTIMFVQIRVPQLNFVSKCYFAKENTVEIVKLYDFMERDSRFYAELFYLNSTRHND